MRDATQSFGAFRQVPLLYSEPPRRGIIEKFEANADGTQPLEEQLRPLGPDTGRGSDKYLAHLNAREVALLDAITKGGGSINPTTGLMEFEDGDGEAGSAEGGVGGDNADGTSASSDDDGDDDYGDFTGIEDVAGEGDYGDFTGIDALGFSPEDGLLYFDGFDPTAMLPADFGYGYGPAPAPAAAPGLFSQMGNFISNSIQSFFDNPINSLFNLALNMSPIGMGLNIVTALSTGKSLPGYLAEEVLGQPASPNPLNVALGQVGQDIAGAFASPQNDPSVAFDARGQEVFSALQAEIEATNNIMGLLDEAESRGVASAAKGIEPVDTDLYKMDSIGPVNTDVVASAAKGIGPVDTDLFGGFDNTSTRRPIR